LNNLTVKEFVRELGTIEIKRKIPSGQRVREGKRDASSELRVH
jgi:hypothetical protein